jgi:hypothetical protein
MRLYTEDICEDPWHWLVVHREDWQVPEYDEETGQHHSFAVAISEAPVERVVLVPKKPGLPPFTLLVPQDARPIMFRARMATALMFRYEGQDEALPVRLFTGFGWQKTINGHNEQCLLAIYDDGSVVLTDDRKQV